MYPTVFRGNRIKTTIAAGCFFQSRNYSYVSTGSFCVYVNFIANTQFIILAGYHFGDGRIVINYLCLYSVFRLCLDGFLLSTETIIIHLGYSDGIIMVSQEGILVLLGFCILVKPHFIVTYFVTFFTIVFSLDDNVSFTCRSFSNRYFTASSIANISAAKFCCCC